MHFRFAPKLNDPMAASDQETAGGSAKPWMALMRWDSVRDSSQVWGNRFD